MADRSRTEGLRSRPPGQPTSRAPCSPPTLIDIGDLHAPDGLEVGLELWRVPLAGWNEPHESARAGPSVPRRFTVIHADGLVRASGYTDTPTCLPGEPFALIVVSPLAA